MAHIETTIDEPHDLITYTVTGSLSTNDILDIIKNSYTKNPKKLVLWDVSGISSFTVAPTDLENISKLIATLQSDRHEGKTAFVIGSENFGFGILYEHFAKIENLPYEYRSFDNMAAAKNWLGV